MSYLVHGLWHRESGLILWIEQVQGHKILTPEQLDEGALPSSLATLLEPLSFAHRFTAHLSTPKGKRVRLPIPVARCYPEKAVAIIEELIVLLDGEQGDSVVPHMAPDLLWIIQFYRGLKQFVCAGRIVLRVRWADDHWWPQWQLLPSGRERVWIARMQLAIPHVLTANGSAAVADDMAEELPHWIASYILQDFEKQPRARELHTFTRTLLRSESLRRGGPALASKLNEWKDSITGSRAELMVIVEDAPTGEDLLHAGIGGALTDSGEAEDESAPAPQLFPVRIQVRFGVDTPLPVHAELVDAAFATRLRDLYNRLLELASTLTRPEVEQQFLHPELDDEKKRGDWDRFLTLDQLGDFLAEDVPRLRNAGHTVMLPRSWGEQELSAKLTTSKVDNLNMAPVYGMDQLLSYDWTISLGGVELDEDEMQRLIESSSGLIELRGSWVIADSRSLDWVRAYVEMVKSHSVSADDPEAELSSAEAKAKDADAATERYLSAAALREMALTTAGQRYIEFRGSDWFSSLMGADSDPIPTPVRKDIPPTVHATLRDYQRRGVDWLYWMARHELGAVLADDMGLGKTLQLLTLLAIEKHEGLSEAPTMVVAPTSVLTNWQREAHTFTPELSVMVYHGTDRPKGEEFVQQAQQCDLVITSYGVLSRDVEWFCGLHWQHLVLDEAQQIKNSNTRMARAAKVIPSAHRIALTGTPIENRLSEIHSLMDFCNYGMLGSSSFFRNHFARAIEVYDDPDMKDALRRLTAPFILRRLKTDPAVIDDLPEKTENVLRVLLTKEQAALYKSYVNRVKKEVEDAESMKRRGLILAAMTRIKQICNHPAHFLADGSSITHRGVHRSGKVAKLIELIDAALDNGEKMLVFTQYRAFGDILVPYLSEHVGREVPFLHGGVAKKKRDAMVSDFQNDNGPPIMVLSLKAGGTGLNLTAANIVVHMDRWWNPAVENQATDRAYRIGQRKDVSVYKMVCEGTMEEAIHDVIEGKLQLASDIVGEGEGWVSELSQEDLEKLLNYRGTVDEDEE
ncbi:ATP-dependent helicase HepA [Corynebacterium ciconiae DSM 44920]|uniref:DEAD/DEAH box helicase n=1 Tax=Corynebacterium ciconiae TaxID=227319 RepID=UPI0003615A4F|nr:DEAD/DEAH box helicase [Corynebacterium ciconiae]WKD60955.1 ATP-dependent helicase HepA [Corynebacterium ciconiae DSM 44920]